MAEELDQMLTALRRATPTARIEGVALGGTRYEVNVLVDGRILAVPIDAIVATELHDPEDPSRVSLTVAEPWRVARADGVAKPDPNWDPPGTGGGIMPRPRPEPDPMPEVHVQFVGANGLLYQIPAGRLDEFRVRDEEIWPLPMASVASDDGGSRPTCEDTKDTGMMGCAR